MAGLRILVALAMVTMLVLCVVGPCSGFVIQLEANDESCFYEDLMNNDKMGVTFEVGTGGNLDIDFRITGPGGRNVYEGLREKSNTYTFLAEESGRYTYCFSNKMSIRAKKTVTFSAVAVDHTQPTEVPKVQAAVQGHGEGLLLLFHFLGILEYWNIGIGILTNLHPHSSHR